MLLQLLLGVTDEAAKLLTEKLLELILCIFVIVTLLYKLVGTVEVLIVPLIGGVHAFATSSTKFLSAGLFVWLAELVIGVDGNKTSAISGVLTELP